MPTGTTVLLDDPHITIGGNQVRNQVTSMSMPLSANMLDVTTFDSAGWTESRPGNKSASISLNAFNEEGTNRITTLIRTAFLAGTSLALVLRADGAAASATNPQYTWTVFVESFDPISGAVGENNTTTFALRPSGPPVIAVA